MNYTVHLSEKGDQQLRQLCEPCHDPPSEAVSPEEFLSAMVEEQLDELFAARRERYTKAAMKNKKLDTAVSSGKQRAKEWRQAATATQIALQSLRKLVIETTAATPKVARSSRSR